MSLARLAAAAVVLAALFSTASAGDEPAPLKFAWPVPAKATVTERVAKIGHTAAMKYTLTLERSGESGDLRLHVGDYEILELDGRPATDPSIAQQLKMTLPMTKTIPDLLLGADGAVKGVLGLDDAISIMIEEMTKGLDERQKAAQVSALRAQFDLPEMRERMKRDSAKQWTAWVANWTGRVIPEGKGVEGTWPVMCPDGTEVTAPTLYRRMSAEKDGPGLVKLTRESTLDGEDAKPAFDAFVAKAESMGRPVPATGMRLVDRVAVLTDPATLRPTWVRREEQRILHMKDLTDRNDIERHDYSFEWPAAEKPKPADPAAPVQPVEPVKPAEGGK